MLNDCVGSCPVPGRCHRRTLAARNVPPTRAAASSRAVYGHWIRPGSHTPGRSHNPPDPAGAGRGKGRPQADPEGTRSALPATEAAGTLIGVGSASPIPRACPRASRLPFRIQVSRQPTARRAVTGEPAASPHPVPKRFNKTHPSSNVANHERPGQSSYQRRATSARSRGGSSRCTHLCGSAGEPPSSAGTCRPRLPTAPRS